MNKVVSQLQQDDKEFQRFVCQALHELTEKHSEMDSRITKHIELTQEMADIVMMGKSLFKMAGWLGKGLRAAAYVATSAVMLWAALHQFFKGFGK